MLPLAPLSWESPNTLDAALRLAAEPGAMLIAGGTDLVPSMKHRIFLPRLLVSTRRLRELDGIHAEDGGLSIGASVTLREIARHPAVRACWPALAAAASTVATPTIQAMGTLAGNVLLDTRCLYYNQPEGWRRALGGCLKCEGSVCHVAPRGRGCYAVHAADTVPSLLLYGASLRVVGPAGERVLPLAQLYGDDGLRPHGLARGEVLLRVELPAHAARVVHRKLRLRGSIDYAQLLTAVSRDDAGWHAVISAVGPQPIRVSAADPGSLVEAAWSAAQPLATHAAAATWRKRMIRVEVGRAVAEPAVGGGGSP